MHKMFIILLLAALVVLGGCETMKGINKDVNNTWDNLVDADKKFQEEWW